ncbi:MAG: acyl-CoA dehydrogenase family protein [Solirubrobacteraceae bacterium]
MTTRTDDIALPLVPSDEELAIRTSVREIVEGFGSDYARTCYAAGEPPSAMWKALAEQGFVGINVPEEWGGGGLGMWGLQLVGEELAAAGGATLMLVVSSAMNGSILPRHGTEAQKERWLRGVAAGTRKIAFAITEPDAGTNSHNLRTELRRDGANYLLRGQKTYISGVEDAQAILVVARLRHDDGTLGKPTLAIIDVDGPGFSRDEIPMPYLGPDKQWTLYFDDVVVEADRLLGGEESGLGVLFDALNPERIIAAALANGMSRRAIDQATKYASEREVWGQPIGAHQSVAHPLAEAKVEMEMTRLMTQKAAVLFDAGSPLAGEASNMAKYAAAKAAVHAVDAGIQTHGGNGFALEYGMSDMWWPARLMRTAPVSEQMVLNHVAQHSLGLPKSY